MSDTTTLTPIPSASEPPKSIYEKIGAALPIALTALATAFAGLSSSEMSRAMYWRSAAAQDQSKAADQWSLAAHKRDRSIMVQTAALQMRAGEGFKLRVPGAEDSFGPYDAIRNAAREWIRGEGPPSADLPEIDDPAMRAVLDGLREGKSEADLLREARDVDRGKLDAAIDSAVAEIKRSEAEWKPILEILSKRFAAVRAKRDREAQADHLELDGRRYGIEANLNQQVGFLYEVRVKSSVVQSDRHRIRSEYFFYAMLAGQAGATLAALALARKQRSALWLFAAFVGVVSLAFGGYVYVTM
jgi:hypothetical protein